MALRKLTHPVGKGLLLLLCCGLLAVWTVLDLGCVFRKFTGLPCPGCGMSRAWLAVLRLDFPAALEYHPMFWCVPFGGLYILWEGTPFQNPRYNRMLGILLAGGLLLCWAARLVLCFFGMETI